MIVIRLGGALVCAKLWYNMREYQRLLNNGIQHSEEGLGNNLVLSFIDFTAALIDVFMLTMIQMTVCNLSHSY